MTSLEDLLQLARNVGPYICLLKVHVDIIGFTSLDAMQSGLQELKAIAEEHDFLIFEDRKFADIGNTMYNQFTGGVYKISSWADITNAHTLPGDGIISGFKKAQSGCSLLLLAEMSSAGNLISGEYTDKTVKMPRATRIASWASSARRNSLRTHP